MRNVTRWFLVLVLSVAFGSSLSGCSGDSSSVPNTPTGVTLTPGNGQVTVTWAASPGATSYNLYWSTSSGMTMATATRITNVTSPYVLTQLTNGTTYYIMLTAMNSMGESMASAPMSCVPALPVPTGVTATPGNGQMTIAWPAVTGATAYNIYWSSTSGVTPATGTKVAGAVSPYILTGLTNGTTYYAVVTAVFGTPESAASTQVSATPSVNPVVAFSSYVGNWSGSWHNNTFGSTGPASLVVSMNQAQTQMSWTITVQGNVFGGTAPPPETFTGAVTPTSITLTGTSATFGQLTLTIDQFGNVTGSGTNVNSPNVSRFDFTGTWTGTTFTLNYTATLTGGGTATGTFSLTKQ